VTCHLVSLLRHALTSVKSEFGLWSHFCSKNALVDSLSTFTRISCLLNVPAIGHLIKLLFRIKLPKCRQGRFRYRNLTKVRIRFLLSINILTLPLPSQIHPRPSTTTRLPWCTLSPYASPSSVPSNSSHGVASSMNQ